MNDHTSVRLTEAQRFALERIAADAVYQFNAGYGAWRITGASPTVVGRLVSIGLARWTKPIGGRAELTDAGRQALSPHKGGQENG